MTDQLDDLHARAALDLLDANAALTTFDGAVPNPYPEPPYVLVYTHVAWPSNQDDLALDHLSAVCLTTWTVHHVGLTAAACRALTMQTRESLLDVTAAVAGRVCFPIRQDDAQVPMRDETTGRPLFDAVVTYSMKSLPA